MTNPLTEGAIEDLIYAIPGACTVHPNTVLQILGERPVKLTDYGKAVNISDGKHRVWGLLDSTVPCADEKDSWINAVFKLRTAACITREDRRCVVVTRLSSLS